VAVYETEGTVGQAVSAKVAWMYQHDASRENDDSGGENEDGTKLGGNPGSEEEDNTIIIDKEIITDWDDFYNVIITDTLYVALPPNNCLNINLHTWNQLMLTKIYM